MLQTHCRNPMLLRRMSSLLELIPRFREHRAPELFAFREFQISTALVLAATPVKAIPFGHYPSWASANSTENPKGRPHSHQKSEDIHHPTVRLPVSQSCSREPAFRA